MKYKRPEMGYTKIGILHNSRVYLKETIVFWERKGKEYPHSRIPKDCDVYPRKGSREVRRWGFYMMFQGCRKSLKRYSPNAHWNPTKEDLDKAVLLCQEAYDNRNDGDIGTWTRII